MTRHPVADLKLALRLMAAPGRSGLVRLGLVTVGVGIGVCLLLLVLTAVPAVQARENRTAWQDTTSRTSATTSGHDEGLWWLANHDHYRGRDVLRVYIAADGPTPLVPPGLTALPAPGQIAASPALQRLLASAPADELAARLPGRITITIGRAGLASPDELVAVVGATPDQIRAWGGEQVHAIANRPATITLNGYARIMMIVLATGLLLPVVVLIGMVTRIDAARREQRLAAIRLAGGTNGQVARIAATETGVAAAVGALAGWLGYLVARPVVAALVTFDGLHFYPGDVRVPAGQLAAVLCGVPVAASVASVVALRRVRVSPLGVTRGTPRRPPGRWRLAVPAAGLVGLAAVVAMRSAGGATANSGTVETLSAVSLLLVPIGLVVAGVWACVAVARVLARLARRAPALMAARRLAADPQATFRAIAGVVLATFVTGLFAGVTPDPEAKTLENSQLRPGVVEVLTEGQPDDQVIQLREQLDRTAGVTRILTVRTGATPGTIAVSCADLAAAVNVACAAGQPVRTPNGLPPRGLFNISGLTDPRDTGPVHALYVFTTDGIAGEDRVRTVTATLLPAVYTDSRTDQVQLDTRQLRELNTGLRTGTAFVMIVAACSLTVSALGALLERRRTFALLRASGVQLNELRGVVLLETVLPLAVTVVASAALGLLTAGAISNAMGQPWRPPGPGFPLATVGALVAAIAVTAATLPLIDMVTRPNEVRFT